MKSPLFLVLIFLNFLSCHNEKGNSSSSQLYIVTTTGMLADVVKNITGENAKVESLMGSGVDPHLYKATQCDLNKLVKADMVFYNGLGLEGKMENVLLKLEKKKPVIGVGNGIDELQLINTNESTEKKLSFDPHIWMDVALWMKAVMMISTSLQESDSLNATVYEENTVRYLSALAGLHEEITQLIATIPDAQRLLITSHDAFGYFGRAYRIEVEGLQGISTAAEVGLQDVTRLVNKIVDRKVKAVFVETSISDRLLKSVVESCRELKHEVKIGGSLYSDALGQSGTPEGNYIGMMRANVNIIVESLK